MKKYLCLAVIFLPAALTGCSHRTVVYGPPPPAYSDAARHGYSDGVHAAQRDLHNGFRPDADRHPRFRNPPVPGPLMEEYRHGFREGYQAVFHGGPGY